MDKVFHYYFTDPSRTDEHGDLSLSQVQALMTDAATLWPDPLSSYVFRDLPKLRKGRKVMTFVGDQTWVVTRTA
jgi:hypothetical protein